MDRVNMGPNVLLGWENFLSFLLWFVCVRENNSLLSVLILINIERFINELRL